MQFAALTYDGKLHFMNIHNHSITDSSYGIRGRDGFVGSASVLESGVKDFFMSNNYCFILKEDKSLHIIGRMLHQSGNTLNNYSDGVIYVKQYEKVQSGVIDVYIDQSLYRDQICILYWMNIHHFDFEECLEVYYFLYNQ